MTSVARACSLHLDADFEFLVHVQRAPDMTYAWHIDGMHEKKNNVICKQASLAGCKMLARSRAVWQFGPTLSHDVPFLHQIAGSGRLVVDHAKVFTVSEHRSHTR